MKRRSFIGGAIAAVFAPFAPALKDMGLIRPSPPPDDILVEMFWDSSRKMAEQMLAKYQAQGMTDIMEFTKPTRIT